MSRELHPEGFRISDKPVAASFAHPYSFQPVTDFLQRDEACLPGSATLGQVDGWVRYWDETSTVAVLDFKVEEPAKTAQQDKKKEKKKAKGVSPAPQLLTYFDAQRETRNEGRYDPSALGFASVRQTRDAQPEQGTSQDWYRSLSGKAYRGCGFVPRRRSRT